jgi:hypothetical protein
MPTKLKIAAGLVAIGVAYDLTTRPLRRENFEFAQTIIRLGRENESLHEQMDYLVNVLNENDIILDEFDLIVLTNVMPKP